MSEPPNARRERAIRRGRRAGIAVFGVLVSGITAIWSLQIIRQVWFSEPGRTSMTCRDGLIALVGSVRRARQAAAAETGGERQALERFRAALADTWRERDAIGAVCQSDPSAVAALGDIDRLRFAEEHAVRYEAVDLARRRRRVQALENELSGASKPDKP